MAYPLFLQLARTKGSFCWSFPVKAHVRTLVVIEVYGIGNGNLCRNAHQSARAAMGCLEPRTWSATPLGPCLVRSGHGSQLAEATCSWPLQHPGRRSYTPTLLIFMLRCPSMAVCANRGVAKLPESSMREMSTFLFISIIEKMTVQRYACHTTMEITENQHSNKKRRQTCDGKTPHEAWLRLWSPL